MPAQSINVAPPALLNTAASVAATAEKAAMPPSAVPHAVPGSTADGAWGAIGAGMAAQSAQMSAEVSAKGPEVQAKTSAGVARLQAQDAENAAQIQTVGDTAVAQAARPGGWGLAGAGSAPSNLIQSVGFKETIIGDDWEEDEWGVFHPPYVVPVVPITGAQGGNVGMGTPPV
jgi:hypothetical protein